MQTAIRNAFSLLETRVKGSHKVWISVLTILWAITLLWTAVTGRYYDWFVFGFATGTLVTLILTISYLDHLVNTGKLIKPSSLKPESQESSSLQKR